MSEHRTAWALHNYELEQTIIRLRNSRNRLWERSKVAELQNLVLSYRILELKAENSKLKAINRELPDIIASP